jgi:hypothetical protein
MKPSTISAVVPAKAGTHTPRRRMVHAEKRLSQ